MSMSQRRQAGDTVWLLPGSGFCGESNRKPVVIQPQVNPPPCCLCDDADCVEWYAVTSTDGVWTFPHVSECEMFDEYQAERSLGSLGVLAGGPKDE